MTGQGRRRRAAWVRRKKVHDVLTTVSECRRVGTPKNRPCTEEPEQPLTALGLVCFDFFWAWAAELPSPAHSLPLTLAHSRCYSRCHSCHRACPARFSPQPLHLPSFSWRVGPPSMSWTSAKQPLSPRRDANVGVSVLVLRHMSCSFPLLQQTTNAGPEMPPPAQCYTHMHNTHVGSAGLLGPRGPAVSS